MSSSEAPVATGNRLGQVPRWMWWAAALAAAVLVGTAAGWLPPRLRLFYVFPAALGYALTLVLGLLAEKWQILPSRETLLTVTLAAMAAFACCGWQAARVRAAALREVAGSSGGKAMALAILKQMPAAEDGEFTEDMRKSMLAEYDRSNTTPFSDWLEGRMPGLPMPLPPLVFLTEMLAAAAGAAYAARSSGRV